MEKNEKNNEYLEKLVHINRITKVVKGGRRFGFSALVVVGNQNGKIGIAHAKAKQVPDAIKKANELARRKLIQIPLREGRTIHHDIYGKDGAGKIKLRSAPKGTGIIAGGPVRAVCEVLGIKDIVAKSLGTGNLGINVSGNTRATPVTTFAGGTNWKQVSAGERSTVAVKSTQSSTPSIPVTNYKDSNGIDLGRKLVTQDYYTDIQS